MGVRKARMEHWTPRTKKRPASYKHRIANNGTAPIGFISESFAKYTPFSLAETSIVPAVTLTNNTYAEPRVRFSYDKHRVTLEAKGITSITAVSTVIFNSCDNSSWADAYLEK